MKTIIAGTRTIHDNFLVRKAIENSGFEITEVVCGKAQGVDTCGEIWAIKNKILIKYFPAQWKRFGTAAGPKRNGDMADYAEACIVIWDGKSRGSSNMINTAKRFGLKLFVVNINEVSEVSNEN